MSIWASLKGIDHPYHYEASHIMPGGPHDERDGTNEVHLAVLPSHVRYYRDNPSGTDEPDGIDPWLRFGVGESTVILSAKQVRRLVRTMRRWLRTLDDDTVEGDPDGWRAAEGVLARIGPDDPAEKTIRRNRESAEAFVARKGSAVTEPGADPEVTP